jgi:hypothetical protein
MLRTGTASFRNSRGRQRVHQFGAESLKHIERRQGMALGVLARRWEKTNEAAASDRFVVNRQHCEDPILETLPEETYYSVRASSGRPNDQDSNSG